MKEVQFYKMVASGNDFIVIDNRGSKFTEAGHSLSEVAGILSERKLSVGADGMLIIEDSKKADFKMRIFNPDGSEVEMCGNGSRCAALYGVERGIAEKDMKIETLAGILEANVVGLKVKLKLTDPLNARLNKSLKIGKKIYKIHSINTGVPHAVIFSENIQKINVERLGREIRHHKSFEPEGTNADFVKIIGPNEISVRTYERGVEAETYACGTGAVASALISSLFHGLKSHIDVNTKSKEILRVYFNIKGKKIKDVYLEGEAKMVYTGRIDYV